MIIQVQEVKKGTWRVNVVPTSKEDAEQEPDAGQIGMTLLSVAHDLLKKAIDGKPEPQIQAPPTGPILLPPGLGRIDPKDL